MDDSLPRGLFLYSSSCDKARTGKSRRTRQLKCGVQLCPSSFKTRWMDGGSLCAYRASAHLLSPGDKRAQRPSVRVSLKACRIYYFIHFIHVGIFCQDFFKKKSGLILYIIYNVFARANVLSALFSPVNLIYFFIWCHHPKDELS